MVIAVISTDQVFLDLMHELLTFEGYQTVLCNSGIHAHDVLCRERPALVLLDLWLEHRNAGEMVLGMMRITPCIRETPVILFTTNCRAAEEKRELFQRMQCETVVQPFDVDDLLSSIALLGGQGYGERGLVARGQR